MADSDDEVRPILGALNPGSETEAGAMLSVSGSVVAEIQGEGMQSNSTSVEGPESFMMNPKRRKVEFSSAAEQMMVCTVILWIESCEDFALIIIIIIMALF